MEYTYFISFWTGNNNDQSYGFGNTILIFDSSLDSSETIREAEKRIVEQLNNKYKKIIILNFQLLFRGTKDKSNET